MISALILHPKTKQDISAFLSNPTHAVLLTGPSGSGKHSLAHAVAAELLGADTQRIPEHPYVHLIVPEERKAIGIEAIRQLEHFLALKVPGSRSTDRVVIIEESHRLTPEAQNALLKTLEEPPKGTVLLLTADSLHALLPTVRSRTQNTPVLPPSKNQLQEALTGHSQEEYNLAYAISGGLPGLMTEILTHPEHQLRSAAKKAREILGKNAYERLLEVDQLSKDQGATKDLLYILQQLASIQLRTEGNPQADRWQSILTAAYDAEKSLNENAQTKLTLTNLMLTL